MDYQIKSLQSSDDLSPVLNIYKSNNEYFQIVSQEDASMDAILKDMTEVPPNTSTDQKCFCLITENGNPIGVIDYIENYPDQDVLYIGLFLVDGKKHNRGIGSEIYKYIERIAMDEGYERIRLGVVQENIKGLRFWQKMGFITVKTVKSSIKPETNWTIHVMEKRLSVSK